jgi:hypothetical protein
MDEESKHQIWLENATLISHNKAYRKITHQPKNLESTGHPSLIAEVDPNPKVISNAPKKRFSKEQRHYLTGVYWNFYLYGELKDEEVIQAFEMRSEWSSDVNAGEKVQTKKATHRSAKRSAKNLAEYGYVTLSYGKMKADTDDMMWNPNQHQPILRVTPTMAAVEKGREFLEQAGCDTEPDREEVKKQRQEALNRWSLLGM